MTKNNSDKYLLGGDNDGEVVSSSFQRLKQCSCVEGEYSVAHRRALQLPLREIKWLSLVEVFLLLGSKATTNDRLCVHMRTAV